MPALSSETVSGLWQPKLLR